MAKKAPETVTMTPNEVKLINMNFLADLGDALLSGSPSFTVSAGGPTASSPTVSTTFAQAKFTASGADPGLYTVTVQVNDNSIPAQTFEGIGELLVEAVAT